MYSLEVIKSMNKKQARRSRGRQPYIAKTDKDPGVFKCPNFGDYRPANYKLTKTHFVDNSGFGADNEPALTAKQFLEKVKAGFGYAVVEAGQFQVYVGEFVQTNISDKKNSPV